MGTIISGTNTNYRREGGEEVLHPLVLIKLM
nr:MAG TPA: hypothetical protein [Crassvirales sp.]